MRGTPDRPVKRRGGMSTEVREWSEAIERDARAKESVLSRRSSAPRRPRPRLQSSLNCPSLAHCDLLVLRPPPLTALCSRWTASRRPLRRCFWAANRAQAGRPRWLVLESWASVDGKLIWRAIRSRASGDDRVGGGRTVDVAWAAGPALLFGGCASFGGDARERVSPSSPRAAPAAAAADAACMRDGLLDMCRMRRAVGGVVRRDHLAVGAPRVMRQLASLFAARARARPWPPRS